jgi:hypothetical protein
VGVLASLAFSASSTFLQSRRAPRIVVHRLEGEIRSISHETIYFTHYHSGRRNGRDFWFQGRQAAGYEIGIYEVDHPRVFGQITACERRLTGTVGTCNQDETMAQ